MTADFMIAHPDESVVRAVRTLLRQEQHHLRIARDGLDAIDQTLDHPPQALLLGGGLAGLDGVDVVRALRALEPTHAIPALFLTLTPQQAAEVERAELGWVDWMTGPLDLERLRQEIARLALLPTLTQGGESHIRRGDPTSLTDPLTGLYARPYLLHRLTYEATRAARYHTHLACLLIGLDQVAAHRQAEGRVRLDQELTQVAALLHATARTADILGRSGPDEFLIIAPHTDQRGAQHLAERVRRRLEQSPIQPSEAGARVTLSIGLAATDGSSLAENLALFGRAQAALSNARVSGNQIVVG